MIVPGNRTHPPLSHWVLGAAGALSVLAATACGSDADSTKGNERSEQQKTYAECMANNGVTLPKPRQRSSAPTQPTVKVDRNSPPPGTDPALWERARAACADVEPSPMKRGE